MTTTKDWRTNAVDQIQKLKELLAEAREALFDPDVLHDVSLCACRFCNLARRIDAALSSLTIPAVEWERTKGSHTRQETWENGTVFLYVRKHRYPKEPKPWEWYAENSERGIGLGYAETREAAKEAALTAAMLSNLEPVPVHSSSLTDVVTLLENERDEARSEVDRAFSRGAEAMREAAARAVEDADDGVSLQCLADAGIREMPLPKDKP